MLAVAVIAGVMVAVAVTPAIALTGSSATNGIGSFDELPSDLKIAALDQKTEVYAKSGGKDVRIASFYAQNREVIGWDDVSDVVKHAAVAGEDVRFYEHGGVDPVGIIRATVGNLSGDDLQGASTITQQYVKNVCVQEAENQATTKQVDAAYDVCTDATIGRKLREARLAIALEKKYTKDEILLGYLNIAGFGGRVYGIQAAAKYYYDTDAKDLSAAQAASLMAIVNNPDALRLDEKANIAQNQDRRDYILGVELKHSLLTKAQYDAAVKTEVKPDITPSTSGCKGVAGFFCDYVRRTVLNDKAFGKTPGERTANLQRSGYKIYTTLDLDLQRKAQDAMNTWVPKTSDVFDVGGAAVTVEPGTGHVVTMVQNKSFDEGSRNSSGRRSAVNYSAGKPLSASSGFQPGSTFKLFTLLQWLKSGHTLNETVDSDPGTVPASSLTACGKPYEGADFPFKNDTGDEGGYQSVLNGTARSINGTFVRMAEQLDLCDIQRTAEDFGVVPLDQSADPQHQAPFILGGAYSVSPLAMASAYAAIADDGKYCSPIAIDRVTTAAGEEVAAPKSSCKQVVDRQVAIAAAYALRGVMSGGTASGDNTSDGLYEFGKTGTTNDAKQLWMIGTTSKATTAVWVGNINGGQNLRETSFPNPCYTSGIGVASDARHCVWKDVQTAVNAKLGGATSWAQPEPQYLYGGAPTTDASTQGDTAAGAVPDTAGMTKDAAAQALIAAGYSWAYGDDVPSDLAAGVVASTEPAAGSTAEPGSQVIIHASAGASG